MSYCELCGSQISGSAFTIVVEDVVMNVCRSCSRHGKAYSAGKKRKTPKEEFKIRLPRVRNDYSKLIKQAREKQGLSQDELGNKIDEVGSVVKLLEEGKFRPDPELAKKIEDSLGITLVEISDIDE